MKLSRKYQVLWILISSTISISVASKPSSHRVAKSLTKRAEKENIDLTFPNCGQRSPKVEENPEKREVAAPYPREDRIKRWDSVIKPIIVGGHEAKKNSWPWMAALIYANRKGKKEFFCGASLISRRYALTAAHCFDAFEDQMRKFKFSIVVGSHTTEDGTEYSVKKVKIHPGWESPELYNDIALLELAKEVTLTNKVYPVCLPSEGIKDRIRPNANIVTVTGWGLTKDNGKRSEVLREVNLPIVPQKECNDSYFEEYRDLIPQGINNLLICAGTKDGNKDACQGDSGGPLVQTLTDNNWVQVGIVSFGVGCGNSDYPGVFTRVSEYTKWLHDNTDLGH